MLISNLCLPSINLLTCNFDCHIQNVTGRQSVALGKPVLLSTEYWQKTAERVVNGFTWGECVSQFLADSNYIMVDLLDYYDVEQIVLYPRLPGKYG